jgi:hypothetical protein
MYCMKDNNVSSVAYRHHTFTFYVKKKIITDEKKLIPKKQPDRNPPENCHSPVLDKNQALPIRALP